MTDWTKTVNTANKKAYSIPEGWSTEEQVAESLGCPVIRVKELLKPGIDTGAIEKHIFPTWSDELQSTKRVTCYRPVVSNSPKVSCTKIPTEERVKSALQRHPDWSDQRIASSIRGANSTIIRKVRETMNISPGEHCNGTKG